MKQSTFRTARWQRGRPSLGAVEPVSECDPESREHPVVLPRRRPVSAPCRFRISGTPRPRCTYGGTPMQLLYARCAGLDVHARQVVACARTVVNQTVTYHRLTVSTTTRGLL